MLLAVTSEIAMLYEFVTTYRDAIIERAREKLTARPWPSASPEELENGVPLFLTQLSERLLGGSTGTPHADGAIGSTATLHGRDLLARGFTVSQVVHDYGDICQSITELALAQNAPINTEEFKTLNACLDTAIAEAVTEHARITAASRASVELERSAHVAHETRDLLNTAILAYQTLKQGSVAINGNTGALLGRSLMGLRDLVDSTLSEIRIAANHQRRERVLVTPFLDDLAVSGRLHAESRGLQLAVELGDRAWAVTVDPQLLASAVTSLLSNAFKCTPAGGRVALRARATSEGHLLIEVEDECGGISDSAGDPFQSSGERQGTSRTGPGQGLSIAREAVRSHGGDIHMHNVPGKGCVFTIDLPLAAPDVPVSPTGATSSHA